MRVRVCVAVYLYLNHLTLSPASSYLFSIGMYADVSALYPLKAFLPRNIDRFYRYDGSLTTPTCNEVVTWTVFDETISISENQVSFGQVKVWEGRGKENGEG